jgi:hypothetical protein
MAERSIENPVYTLIVGEAPSRETTYDAAVTKSYECDTLNDVVVVGNKNDIASTGGIPGADDRMPGPCAPQSSFRAAMNKMEQDILAHVAKIDHMERKIDATLSSFTDFLSGVAGTPDDVADKPAETPHTESDTS